jgi:hypothetical protein
MAQTIFVPRYVYKFAVNFVVKTGTSNFGHTFGQSVMPLQLFILLFIQFIQRCDKLGRPLLQNLISNICQIMG